MGQVVGKGKRITDPMQVAHAKGCCQKYAKDHFGTECPYCDGRMDDKVSADDMNDIFTSGGNDEL